MKHRGKYLCKIYTMKPSRSRRRRKSSIRHRRSKKLRSRSKMRVRGGSLYAAPVSLANFPMSLVPGAPYSVEPIAPSSTTQYA